MKLSSLTTLAALCCLVLLQAQGLPNSDDAFQLPVRSAGALSFHVDVCQFQGGEKKTVIECYYSVPLDQFRLETAQSEPAALLRIDFTLLGPNNDTLTTLHDVRPIVVPAKERQAGLSFVDVKRVETGLESMTLELVITDDASKKYGAVKKYFHVRDFSSALSLSDLLLSSQVQKVAKATAFDKGGLEVIPNVARTFPANETQKLFVYFEINNFKFDPDSTGHYRLEYRVHDLAGKEIFFEQKPMLPKTASGTARLEVVTVPDSLSGFHKVIVQVTDLTTNESTSENRYLSFFDPGGDREMFLPMSKEDIEKYYDQIKYIATEEEKKLYRNISDVGKQAFLLNFWRARDPDPLTSENEFMIEYFKRIAYCEKEFIGGINSDMGRVYLKYGPPMEINREFSRREFTKPVEIWIYALEGSIEFVFVDRVSDGKYVLVHSTHEDEINNDDWKRDAQ